MSALTEQGSRLADLERRNQILERRLLRYEQAVRLLQDIQRGNSNLLKSLLQELETEKEKSDKLLRDILPEKVIQRLGEGEKTIADSIPCATVVFTDFVGFTPISAGLSALELVETLNEFYTAFDEAARRIDIEKIKTIGDAYLAASGLTGDQEDHAEIATEFALAIRDIVRSRNNNSHRPWRMRAGVHSGSLTAGVIGRHKFAYDIWGDTVNVASRIESICPPDEVLVSRATAARLSDRFHLMDKTQIELKGRGTHTVFQVDRRI